MVDKINKAISGFQSFLNKSPTVTKIVRSKLKEKKPVRVKKPSPKKAEAVRKIKKTAPKPVKTVLMGDEKNFEKAVEYVETGEVPGHVYAYVSFKTPSDVKYLGLQNEYVGSSYLKSLGRGNNFKKTYVKKYESLSPVKQFEYQIRFNDMSSKPMKTWKHYPGGVEYIKTHRSTLLPSYIQSKGGYKGFFKDVDVVDLAYKSASKGGLSPSRMRSKDFIDEYAFEQLTMTSGQRREHYFSHHIAPVRWYSSFFYATASAALFPVTLAQTGVKTVSGGKTFLFPDVNKTLKRVSPGGPSGIVSTGIGEGIGMFTGDSPGLWKKFSRDPISGFFATVGELFGFYLGGQSIHAGKVGIVKGGGMFRGGMLKYTGVNLPNYSQISYWFPQRILRRGWVKLGTKNIDDVIGKPFHSVDTLTPGGLSFAPGRTPSGRISWTVGKTKETTGVFDDLYTLSSASSQRVGFKYTIQSKVIHELPGMSFTPVGFSPTRFYRFGPSSLSYGSSVSLLPRLKLPTAIVTKVKRVFQPPKGSYKSISKWVVTQPKGSWSVISPKMYMGGPETELNIFGKTIIKRYLPSSNKTFVQRLRGYQYHADVPLLSKGFFTGKPLIEKVPVVFTRPVHKGFPSGVKLLLGESSKMGNNIGRFKNFVFGSSTSQSSISIISFKSLASIGFKPSIFSYSKPFSSISIPSYSKLFSYSSFYSKSKSSISSSMGLGSLSSIFSSLSKPSIPSGYSSSSPSIPSIPSFPSIPSPSSPSSPSIPSITIPSFPSYFKKYPESYYTKRKIKFPDQLNLFDVKYRFRGFNVPRIEKIIKKMGI